MCHVLNATRQAQTYTPRDSEHYFNYKLFNQTLTSTSLSPYQMSFIYKQTLIPFSNYNVHSTVHCTQLHAIGAFSLLRLAPTCTML